MPQLLSYVGLLALCSIFSGALLIGDRPGGPGSAHFAGGPAHEATVRLLAVGDINLGRAVGQEILRGDTLHPFRVVRDTLLSYDIVFGNLESQLSDQGGETQHPRRNLVFTGPPAGSFSLKRGGMTVVSTANNHALDYGFGAHAETIRNLEKAELPFAGTALSPDRLFDPVFFEKKGIRFALFACTAVMNIEDNIWRRYVTPADSALLFPRIRETRRSVDFVILSYHGGAEYADRPTAETVAFARSALGAGVDLFLGHHPHVPQGVEEVEGRLIVYSLGNFVFRQPFEFWTQRSFAFAAEISRTAGGRATISRFRCIPVEAGLQPGFLRGEPERRIVLDRLRKLSNLDERGLTWFE